LVRRNELTEYLRGLYDYAQFEDFCENGLQVEGKEGIHKIAFSVSFNVPFLQAAIQMKADAMMVHHGIFQSGVFKIKGALKHKIKQLLAHDISLYGIHLPMDAHMEIGHNTLLMSAIGATDIEPFNVGYTGRNVAGHSLDAILDIYHSMLHPKGQAFASQDKQEGAFLMSQKHGFAVLPYGPEVPQKIAIVSGGGASYYQKAIDLGVDTFFSGNIEEYMPSISLENCTNYINLGHYYSEKPGVLALMKRIQETFDVDVKYIEIANPI
jgi:dinuclear metal center YbgI/SA1388 family protein